jgi:hypothetical protein
MSFGAEIGDRDALKLSSRVLSGPVALLAMFHELQYPSQYPEDFSDVLIEVGSLTVMPDIHDLPPFEATQRIRSVALPIIDELKELCPNQPPYRRMLGWLTYALVEDNVDQFTDNSGMPLMPDAILPPQDVVESMDREWGYYRVKPCWPLEQFIVDLRQP